MEVFPCPCRLLLLLVPMRSRTKPFSHTISRITTLLNHCTFGQARIPSDERVLHASRCDSSKVRKHERFYSLLTYPQWFKTNSVGQEKERMEKSQQVFASSYEAAIGAKWFSWHYCLMKSCTSLNIILFFSFYSKRKDLKQDLNDQIHI